MFTAALIIACLYVLGFSALLVAVLRAPEGFEDREGFHTGRDSLADLADMPDESAL